MSSAAEDIKPVVAGAGSVPNALEGSIRIVPKLCAHAFGLFVATATIALSAECVSALDSHLKENRLKALAVSTAERPSEVPTIPSAKAAGGLRADYDVMARFGYFAPAGVPDKIVDTIQQDVTAILNESDGGDALQIRGYVRAEVPRPKFGGSLPVIWFGGDNWSRPEV
jgi:hypothetical protein